MFTVSADPALLDRDAIYRYLSQESYWARGLPRDVFDKSLQNSLCLGAYAQDGAQAGFARVITDYSTFAYLCDVFVLEPWRGRGVSKALLAAVLEHPDLQHLRRFLLATADAHGLYAQFGFTPIAQPERLMQRLQADVYQRLAAAAQA